jgi:hypothetical protein
LLLVKPIAVAAVPPFGEVLRADGFGAEMGGENSLNLGEPIKPSGQELGLLACLEALV